MASAVESPGRQKRVDDTGESPDASRGAGALAVLQAPWASVLCERELDRVVATTEERTHPRDGCIARCGDRVEHWIGIVEGFAKMSVGTPDGRASTLTGVCDGVWFGEGSLIKHEPRRYDVYALRPTRVLRMPRDTFEWLRATSFAFNHYLQELLNARLSLFIGILEHDRLLDTDARIAHSIASLFQDDLYARAPRFLNLRQAEIALLANVSRQRANVALKRLDRLGLVRLETRGVTVPDAARLREWAAGRAAGRVAQSAPLGNASTAFDGGG